MISIIEKHFRCNRNSLVKRVKYRTGGNEADAEDIVQEAYLRAILYKDSFEMGMNFGHWLNRIVANAYKKWKQDQFNHTLSDEFDENAVDPIDERHTQENLIQRISAEISTLKKVDHQEILRLNLVQGFNPREVAEITNIKYWTVVSLIQKFKKKIKEQHA